MIETILSLIASVLVGIWVTLFDIKAILKSKEDEK